MISTLGIKNLNSKGKLKVKEKNTKSDYEDEGSNLLMKAQISRRRETRNDDHNVRIATNLITTKILDLKIKWTS